MLVLQLTPGALRSLLPHRTRPGWEICEENGAPWLRCPLDAAHLETTAGLPCLARYRDDGQGRLLTLQGTVPVGQVPPGPWQALGEFLTLTPFPARLPGRPGSLLAITLARSPQERPAAALLAGLTEVLAWAEHASRLRFAPLTFAAAPDGRLLVLGTPLPPVPGVPCYRHGPLVLPCGWDFGPPVLPAWVQQALALPPGALALIHPDARMEAIPQEAVVPLTLAALRRTAALNPPVPRP